MLHQFNIWKFLAGLGIFLFGMYFVENSLKNLAGRNFKKFIRNYTTNPAKGILTGIMITALVQSSSVVSLMVLAFVGAGILKLKNAIGIIFGSNLGTTFTGWIVVILGFKLDIEQFAFPMIATGGLALMFFPREEKLHELARFILGFGFLFLGLQYMKMSIDQLTNYVDIKTFAGRSPYILFPVGLILSAIIQSSSATMVICLSAINAGFLPLESAAAIILGSDLGTTVSVMLGSVNGTSSKKRVALSHILFNLFIVLFTLPFLLPIISVIKNISHLSDPLILLVLFHSTFNLLGILLLFPFIGPFAQVLEKKFLSDQDQVSKFLGRVPSSVPDAAMEALKKEIFLLIEQVFYLNTAALKINRGLFSFPKEIKKREDGLFKSDNYMDDYAMIKQLEGEIIAYYLNIQNEKLESTESELLNNYIHAVRNAMISAKLLKDVVHNIREFENSSNDAKQGLYLFLKGQLNEFYLSLHQTFHSSTEALHYERLSDLLKENQQIYQRFLNEIYNQIGRKSLNEIEISSFLNVNREIFNANRSLILSIKDLLLKREDAETFNTIPELSQ